MIYLTRRSNVNVVFKIKTCIVLKFSAVFAEVWLYQNFGSKNHMKWCNNNLGKIQQLHHKTTTWRNLLQLAVLCWLLLEYIFLLIWGFFLFILSFYKPNLAVSVTSLQEFHWIPTPDDGHYRNFLEGSSVMYWNIALVEDRRTWDLDSEIPDFLA